MSRSSCVSWRGGFGCDGGAPTGGAYVEDILRRDDFH